MDRSEGARSAAKQDATSSSPGHCCSVNPGRQHNNNNKEITNYGKDFPGGALREYCQSMGFFRRIVFGLCLCYLRALQIVLHWSRRFVIYALFTRVSITSRDIISVM